MVDVIETSAKARRFLAAARDWVGQSRNSAVCDNSKLKRGIGYALYRQTKLEEAALTQMSVGVYGASQAGKSYFVSALAKGKSKSVSAQIGERQVDFLTEINPSGGKESTGLVTRLTRQPIAASNEFPILISLLSELDLVKIVANSFYQDIEPEPEPDIYARLAPALKVLSENQVNGASAISVEALIDLGFYCDKHFVNCSYYAALKQSGYWALLEQLAPSSDLQSRQRCYGMLWDNSAPYNRLFKQLSDELARFGGAANLICEPSALFDVQSGDWRRSENSVINVTALESLGSAAEKKIKVLVANSSIVNPVSLGIGSLSALASEISISIASEPHEFFENADLLDFPGARSRHPINRQKFEEVDGLPIDHFLRGKVAYLFERYCSNFGMSALLLCVGPSNQEVVGLNRLVEDWIADTVGVRPEQREGQPVSLFAVLTKFDSEFVMDAGKAIDESRWSTRITASLVKPFGGQQSARTHWLDKWDNKSAFQNTYWWRSPSADQPGLIKYGPNRLEASILEDRRAEIDQFRHHYLQSEPVRRHIRNPEVAWDAALALNDGGAQLIVSNLALVCRPELRSRQIHGQLVQNCEVIVNQISNYHVTGNIDEMQNAKLKLAGSFLQGAAGILRLRRGAEFLSELIISEQSGIAIYEEIRSGLQWSKLTTKSAKTHVDFDLDAFAMLGLPGTQTTGAQATSQEETLVRAFVTQWASIFREKFLDPNMTGRFGVHSEFVEAICTEAVTGLDRTGGMSFIAKALEHQHYQHENSWKSATIVTTLVNDFLVYTIINGQRVRQVIRPDGAAVTIFGCAEPGNNDAGALSLSESSKSYSRQFLADWAMGFYEMIKQNAFIDLSDEQMIEENQRLGSILADFSQIKAI